MKFLFTLILCFQCIGSYAQQSFLVDILHSDTLFYKTTKSSSFVNPSVNKNNKIPFYTFTLSDVKEHVLMTDTIESYFNSIHQSDNLFKILQKQQDLVNNKAQATGSSNSFQVETIQLSPVSYLNKVLFFRSTIGYKTTPNLKSTSFIHTYYAYHIKTGKLYNQNQIKSGLDTKRFFKALKKKWTLLCKQSDLDKVSGYIDYTYLKESEQAYDSVQSVHVLPLINQFLNEEKLEDIVIYWTGVGVMVQFKNALYAHNRKQLNHIQIHLDLNEIPKSCFNRSIFPRSFSNYTKQNEIENFRSLMTIQPIHSIFSVNYINLLRVNKNISQMDLMNSHTTPSSKQPKNHWLYIKGKLTKRLSDLNTSNYSLDSLLWNKDKLYGYIQTKFENGLKKRILTTTLKWDNAHNLVGKYTVGKNYHIKRNVFINNAVASFEYTVFEKTSSEPIQLNWYVSNKTGWLFTNGNGESQIYIDKGTSQKIIGDRTILYNRKGQLAQEWADRTSFVLYNYNKNNQLSEISQSSPNHKIQYEYKYDQEARIREIKKRDLKEKQWQKLTFIWTTSKQKWLNLNWF